MNPRFLNTGTSRRRTVAGLLVAFVWIGVVSHVIADDDSKRPEWDQEQAIAKVKSLIAKEDAEDFAWDAIQWMTDKEAAVERARQEQKPIFLYFFLKGNSGPVKASC